MTISRKMFSILFTVLFSIPASAAHLDSAPLPPLHCSEQLMTPTEISLVAPVEADLAAFTEDVSEILQKDLESKGIRKSEARGYAIIIAAMIGSAAATTYVTSALPSDFQFLSQFLAQVSTLGVYVFGAPIWEPISSGFRKMAFGVRTGVDEAPPAHDGFERMWRRTQEQYSLNAQMSRNVVNQFIMSVQQNFYEAHRAINTQDSNYAAEQMAEAAFRLKTLFKDISPGDPSVAAVVRSSFTNHVVTDGEFRDLVLAKLERLDKSFSHQGVRDYYLKTLELWLKN